MSNRPYPLDKLQLVEYHPRRVQRAYTPEEARRMVLDACEADDRRGDRDVAEFERSAAVRDRATRRQKRAAECRTTAAVCFVAMAVMLLPTLAIKWPGETLLVAAAVGAVVGIARAAKAGNPEW